MARIDRDQDRRSIFENDCRPRRFVLLSGGRSARRRAVEFGVTLGCDFTLVVWIGIRRSRTRRPRWRCSTWSLSSACPNHRRKDRSRGVSCPNPPSVRKVRRPQGNCRVADPNVLAGCESEEIASTDDRRGARAASKRLFNPLSWPWCDMNPAPNWHLTSPGGRWVGW